MLMADGEVTRSMHYSSALAAGFVSGLGFGLGRETPKLSSTNPNPFLSVSRKLMVPLPFRSSFDPDRLNRLPL
jgi:hypothetical protein